MKRIIFPLFLVLLLAGCSQDSLQLENGEYAIYYMNMEETALVREKYAAVGTTADTLIPELLEKMKTIPEENEHILLLNDTIRVEGYQYDGSNVELHMNQDYLNLPKTKEVLVRAGLVRTLVQINGVDTVSFIVGGMPLCDSKGIPIGRLNEKSFIENSGKQINSYKNETITLYFTDQTGAKLVEESRRLYYSSNVALEQVVVEQLLKGPKNTESYPTLPGNAKVMSVTVVDNICYVNFDEVFSAEALSIQEQIPIYSVVNSIIDNCNVNQVQISINGESDVVFRENMKLSEFYKMNYDLILKDER